MDRNTKRPNLSTGSPTIYKLNFVEIPKRNVSCVTETSEKKNRIKLIYILSILSRLPKSKQLLSQSFAL